MRKKNKFNLEIEITEISVNDGYYEIHYKYRVDGKKWKNDMYDSDFDNGMSDKLWKLELEKGEALNTVLLQIAENFN